MTLEMQDIIKTDFDSWGSVYNVQEFMDIIKSKLSEKGYNKQNSRLVFSVCPDDINRLQEVDTLENALTKEFNGEFHLGGLGAYPMGGVSGMTAASHHPPDIVNGNQREDGNLLFYISPHLGLIKESTKSYGKIIRPGQTKITSSCGAMMGFLAALKEAGAPENFIITPDDKMIDPTRIALHTDLIKNYSEDLKNLLKIEDSNQQVIDLFKLNYTVVANKAKQIIEAFKEKEKDHYKGNIGFIGGLTVNLPGNDNFIVKEIEL
ncbi:MAG: hypothetical protein ACTSR8_15715 [Promethearchaeota archaeon]